MAEFVNDSGVTVFEGQLRGADALQPPIVLAGTDPNTVPLTIEGTPDQGANLLLVKASPAGQVAINVSPDGADGIFGISLVADTSPGTEQGSLSLSQTGTARLRGTVAVMLQVPLVEPDDALLNEAHIVLVWLDNTNGATKVMFKALQADDSVVTGAVALT